MDRDSAAMAVDDLLDDREAEPGARQRTRLVGAVEAIEDVRQRIVRYAGPRSATVSTPAAVSIDVDDRRRRD